MEDRMLNEDNEGDLVDELEMAHSHLTKPSSIDDYPREIEVNNVLKYSTLDSIKKEVSSIKEMETYINQSEFECGVLVEHIKDKDVEMVKCVIGGKLKFFGSGEELFDPRDYILKSK
jgi:hypothetical protein